MLPYSPWSITLEKISNCNSSRTPRCSRWICHEEVAAHREYTLGQVFWKNLWPLRDSDWSNLFLHRTGTAHHTLWNLMDLLIHAGAVVKELYSMGRTQDGAVHEELSLTVSLKHIGYSVGNSLLHYLSRFSWY